MLLRIDNYLVVVAVLDNLSVVNHILLGVVECRVPVLIKGSDKDDPQKMGSAITYAKRYGLQSIYGLGQDDDGNLASGKENTNGQK